MFKSWFSQLVIDIWENGGVENAITSYIYDFINYGEEFTIALEDYHDTNEV